MARVADLEIHIARDMVRQEANPEFEGDEVNAVVQEFKLRRT